MRCEPLASGALLVVSDGVGGAKAGEVASKMAVDNVPHIFSKYAQEGPIAALHHAFTEANATIHKRGKQTVEFKGMGTTGTALVLRPEGAWVGHVGDSRAYRVRGAKIEQLTFDHSLVWELARRQKKDPDQIQGVPSNVIIRCRLSYKVPGPNLNRPSDQRKISCIMP